MTKYINKDKTPKSALKDSVLVRGGDKPLLSKKERDLRRVRWQDSQRTYGEKDPNEKK